MSDVVVFAFAYATDLRSKKKFKDFDRWSEAELPEQVSAWRTRRDDQFAIVVVDESGGRAHAEFPWEGEPVELAPADALAFLEQRYSTVRAAFLAGEHGRRIERKHYGEASAPRLRDGVWTSPRLQG